MKYLVRNLTRPHSLPTAKLRVMAQKSNFVIGALEPATFTACTYQSNEIIQYETYVLLS